MRLSCGLFETNLTTLFDLFSCNLGDIFGKVILSSLKSQAVWGDLQPLQQANVTSISPKIQKEQMQKLQAGAGFALVSRKIME